MKGGSCFSGWPVKDCKHVEDDGDFCARCIAADPLKCHAAVHEQGRGVGFYRCTKKHRPDDIFCGTHRRAFDFERARRSKWARA